MSAEKIPAIPRTLRHMDTDEQWAERDTVSKLYCTATEAAQRLRGIANILYGLGVGGSHGVDMALFMGGALKDIGLALERVTKAQWAEWEAANSKPVKRLPAPAMKSRRAAA
jgi:hypothetical protein